MLNMQTFIDTATSQVWAFDNDVTVNRDKDGSYTFTAATGAELATPATLQPYTPLAPDGADKLAAAQVTKVAEVYSAYQAAVQIPVQYRTVAGLQQTFQADTASQDTLLVATTGYSLAGATPAGFYWVALDNTQVPFALDDLKGLFAVMLEQGNAAFNKLQTLKAAVRAAKTAADVEAVSWEAA